MSIVEWLLSPIADKNTFTGGIIDNYCQIKEGRRRARLIDRDMDYSLREREVRALERIADKLEEK